MTVRAMREGAVEFLTKPTRARDLLAAIHAAIERDRSAQRARRDADALRERYARLTARERSAFPHRGRPSEQADRRRAGDERAHRRVPSSHIMEKMAADSVAELVRMAAQLGLGSQS